MTKKAKPVSPRDEMSFTRIFLFRHPEVKGFSEGKFWGQTDVGLTDRGKAQLESIAQRMAREKLTAVYCSDLKRTRQVAEAVGRTQNPLLKPRVEKRLREMSLGVWEGLTFKEIDQRHPGELKARQKDLANYCIEQGESVNGLAQRVMPAFEEIAARHSGERICLVSHAGVNRVILSQLVGAPLDMLFRLDQDFACLNLIDIFEDEMPLIRRLNQPSHPS
ncbi:MAG: histidine phosphatase family protein [Desulfarculaceae bacterium]|jgi:alpha-ribazole phosphatase/probable phosphoglycerate mutase